MSERVSVCVCVCVRACAWWHAKGSLRIKGKCVAFIGLVISIVEVIPR